MIQTAKKIRKIESRASLAAASCPGGGKPQEARKLPMPASPPNRTSNFSSYEAQVEFLYQIPSAATLRGSSSSVYTDEGFPARIPKTGEGFNRMSHGCPGWEN